MEDCGEGFCPFPKAIFISGLPIKAGLTKFLKLSFKNLPGSTFSYENFFKIDGYIIALQEQ